MSAAPPEQTVTHLPGDGPTVAYPSAGASRPSAPRVELVRDTASDDPALFRFIRGRLRLHVAISLVAWVVLSLRELTATDASAPVRLAIFLTALALELVLAALTWRGANTLRRCWVLSWATAAIFIGVIAAVQFESLRRPEFTSRVFADGVRSVLGVHYANGWAVIWFAVIIVDAALYPRTVRWTLFYGLAIGLIPVSVCGAVYLVNDALGAADLRVLLLQTAFWVTLGTALGMITQRRLETLQKEADQAKRFGQYRLARRLGAGGMGEVFLAEHLLLKRPSVIKMVRADRTTDPALLARFEREVRILATLTHPNTVAVFDYGHTADGTFYYVMEYLPGLDLDQLVAAHGPLPPDRAVHLLRQVCRALREAHAAGLIHRDVKPNNVMVCERGGVPDVAKLLDFGLVQADAGGSDRLTTHGAIMGTPAYMSPEQAAGLPTDPRSDVYSLGATAYFALAGRPPFERQTAMLTITAHMTEPPPPLPDAVPADLAAVVARCLAKKPEERFADVRQLDAALAGCACADGWTEPDAATWWSAHRPPGN